MALGKAFIEVHADTRPFAQELGKELGRILKAVENGPARKAGEKLGKELGDGASDGFAKAFKTPGGGGGGGRGGGKTKAPGFFDFDTSGLGGQLAKGLVDSIDDGLSGLPPQLKAALGLALVAALPVAAGIGGAVAGALIASLTTVLGAGLGVAIAFQLSAIRTNWTSTLRFLQRLSVEWAQPVVGPLLTAFGHIRDRAESMGPEIARFFELGSRAIVPLTDGILDLVENALPFINSAMTNIDTFADIIASGFGEIGTEFGRAIDQIANDDDAITALNDIIVFTADIIKVTGRLIKLFLDLYGAVRAVGEALDVFGLFDFSVRLADGIRQTDDFDGSLKHLLTTTETEAEALEELNDQLDAYIRSIDDSWSANINFEQSLDDLVDGLKKHRGQLDINTQAGRDNQENLKDAAIALVEQRKQTILLTGDTETANAVFAANKQRLIDQAIAGGITRQKFDELTAAILGVPPPVVTGVAATSLENLRLVGAYAAHAAAAIAQMIANSRGLSSIRFPDRPRLGFPEYAHGGIFNTPTLGVFGEAGEEVLIPTSKPARAAELISQSPMLSSMMSPNVNVYIGNQQIDAYIDQRVARSQAAIARGLSYGSRSL